MKSLQVMRVRPEEPFFMPSLELNRGMLLLSRPMVLKPRCSGIALTNTSIAIPKGTLAFVAPLPDMLHKKQLLATPFILGERDMAEISIPLYNLSAEHSVTLKSGHELASFQIYPALSKDQALDVAPVSVDLVTRMPNR